MRVAVTGSGGRLGRAVVAQLATAFTEAPLAWDLPDHDLDDPSSAERLLAAHRPDIVVHCAAWTDVDGCARDPQVAMRRNGEATGELAEACRRHRARMLAISTNEVFDGRRTDGYGYRPEDEPNPINPYGASKLAGEEAARRAFADAPAALTIVRTAWLFGPGAADFPTKILEAARRAVAGGEPLRAVADEWGNPTYVEDLAGAIVELVERGPGGTYHVVNGLFARRSDWARYVVGRAGLELDVVDVPASTWQRPSTPPLWGVLEPTPLPSGRVLRVWPDAMAEYAPLLLETRSST